MLEMLSQGFDLVSSVLVFLILANQITSDLIECRKDMCRKLYPKSADVLNNLLTMEQVDFSSIRPNFGPNRIHSTPVSTQPLLTFVPSIRHSGEYQYRQFLPTGFSRSPLTSSKVLTKHNSFRSQFDQRAPQNQVFQFSETGVVKRPQNAYPEGSYLNDGGDGHNWALEIIEASHKPQAPQNDFKPSHLIDIQIIPALAFALPPEITTYHPIHIAQEYLLDTTTKSYSTTEKVHHAISTEHDQVQEENSVQEKSEEKNSPEKNISNQYHQLNRKPITFDGKRLNNVIEIIESKSNVLTQKPEIKLPDEEDKEEEDEVGEENFSAEPSKLHETDLSTS